MVALPPSHSSSSLSCRACVDENEKYPCQITRDEEKFFQGFICQSCKHPQGSHVSASIADAPVSGRLATIDEIVIQKFESLELKIINKIDQALAPAPNINLSSSELGHRLLASCPGKFEVAVLPAHSLPQDSRPIVDAALYTQISDLYYPPQTRTSTRLPAEKLLVAAFTPTLANLVKAADRDSDLVLVNSEEIPWIPSVNGTAANRDKPDLFVIPRVALITREPSNPRSELALRAAEIRSSNPEAYLFGECAFPLRDSVRCLLEAKKQISLQADLGEIFPKLQNLFHSTSVLEYRCILFDPTQLYFLVFNATGLCAYYHSNWTTPRSRAFFLDFLSPQKAPRPIWLESLVKSCEHFKVTPVSFLGSGATGKVFKVKSKETPEECWALKVAEKPLHSDPLGSEAGIMKRIRSSLAPVFIKEIVPFLAPACEAPFVLGDPESPVAGSILLGPVGDSIAEEERSFELFSQLFQSLFLLHRYHIRHGDPRIPNIIRVCSLSCSSEALHVSTKSRLVWIDLRETRSDFSVYGEFVVDSRIFFRSFFKHSREAAYAELEEEYGRLWMKGKLSPTELTNCSAPDPPAVPVEFDEFAFKVWKSLNGSTH